MWCTNNKPVSSTIKLLRMIDLMSAPSMLAPFDISHLHTVAPSIVPTQLGPLGIRYDFNDGARVLLPEGRWHVKLIDADSGNTLFSCDSEGGWVLSSKKYFVRFLIQVWQHGHHAPLIDHVLSLRDRNVLISFPVGTLGDLIGWFPYAERFAVMHQCRLECTMEREIAQLFADEYPAILLSSPDEVVTTQPYATYRIGVFFGGNSTHQPIDFRMVGLHRTAGHILGVDSSEAPPRLTLNYARRIEEPYVCIATQSSCQAKYWNNGQGWSQVINHIKKLGYRVICIDKHAINGIGFVWNHIPHGAEDFTGDIPLRERVALLQHAAFFVGLSSGLSWLAWAAQIPVVLISGFTLPICEFSTPYRVFNSHGCNGCWDDMTLQFDHQDFFWCPRHKGTERQFECSRLITAQQVIMPINFIHSLQQLA